MMVVMTGRRYAIVGMGLSREYMEDEAWAVSTSGCRARYNNGFRAKCGSERFDVRMHDWPRSMGR